MEVQVAPVAKRIRGKLRRLRQRTRAQQLRQQFKHRRPYLLAEVLIRDAPDGQPRCMHCDIPIPDVSEGPFRLTVEHIVALNDGGTNDLSNLGLAHHRCNR